MIAKNLLSNTLAPLSTRDTGEQALSIMNIYHVKDLPLVSKKKYLCSINENFILENDMNLTIDQYKLPYTNIYCYENDHLFEIIQKMSVNKLSTITVINSKEEFVGIIAMDDILHFFGNSYSFSELGSIIILETARINYSLAEIAAIAESEGVLIYSSFVTTDPESNALLVTLKVNSLDISAVILSYKRHGYTVSGTFTEEEYVDTLKERYDSLMNYLSI